MNFIIGLPISTDWKRNNCDSILIIVNWPTKMIYYKPVKVIINAPDLPKIIMDMVVRHYNLFNWIVTN